MKQFFPWGNSVGPMNCGLIKRKLGFMIDVVNSRMKMLRCKAVDVESNLILRCIYVGSVQVLDVCVTTLQRYRGMKKIKKSVCLTKNLHHGISSNRKWYGHHHLVCAGFLTINLLSLTELSSSI